MAFMEGTSQAQNFVEEIDFNEILELEVVGKGSFGVVWKGKWRDKYVAVKHIESANEIQAFTVEVRQLSRVNHPNIVKLYGACTKNPVCLVMEYAEGGSLYNVLHCKPLYHYNAGHAVSWALQCAKGVAYLHGMTPKALIHRDLKPPNLLLIMGGKILKICDFGTACDQRTYMSNNKGSAAWMAPEVFEGFSYTEKCDVFSWGIILWEILARKKPFDEIGMSAFRILWGVHIGERPPLIHNCPPPLEQLMISCWDKYPDNRPSMEEVVHIMSKIFPYFSGHDEPLRYVESPEGSPMGEDDADAFSQSMSDEFFCTQEEITESFIRNAAHQSIIDEGKTMKPQVPDSRLTYPLHIQVDENTWTLPDNKENVINTDPECETFSNGPSLTCSASSNTSNRVLQPIKCNKELSHCKRNGCSHCQLNHIVGNTKIPCLEPVHSSPRREFPAKLCHDPYCKWHPNDELTLKESKDYLPPGASENSGKNASGEDNTKEELDNVYLMLDPQFHPIAPDTTCKESVKIFEQHKQLAREYLQLETEIALLSGHKDQLAEELSKVEGLHQLDQQDTEHYKVELRKLENEKESLVKLFKNLKTQLEIIQNMRSAHNNPTCSGCGMDKVSVPLVYEPHI